MSARCDKYEWTLGAESGKGPGSVTLGLGRNLTEHPFIKFGEMTATCHIAGINFLELSYENMMVNASFRRTSGDTIVACRFTLERRKGEDQVKQHKLFLEIVALLERIRAKCAPQA